MKFLKTLIVIISLALFSSELVFAQETEIPTVKKSFTLKQKGEIYFRLRVYDKAIPCDDQMTIYSDPVVISKKGSLRAILRLDVNSLSTLIEVYCSDKPVAAYRMTPWNSINVQTAKTIQFNYPKYFEGIEEMPFELIVQRERPCDLKDVRYCD